MVWISVTRFGVFWKFFVTNYISKVAQMFIDFWDILKTLLFKLKVLYYYFGNLRKKLGYFLINYLVTLVLMVRWPNLSKFSRLRRLKISRRLQPNVDCGAHSSQRQIWTKKINKNGATQSTCGVNSLTAKTVKELDRGSGQVVSVLPFYSDDLSSNPTETYSFFCTICVGKERK